MKSLHQAIAAGLLQWNKNGGPVTYFERITFDPQLMGGQACVRGMRIPASLVLNLMAKQMPVDEILREYADLEPEDLQACLAYGAWLAREEVLPNQARF
ncbi:DUF433 domain-containing protein [bacterium]|nr:DUF433 domain-containing protein [bacterium]